MRKQFKIILAFLIILVVACNSEPSLQKYYVKHQEDDNFVVLDLPMSMLTKSVEMDQLSEESQKSIQQLRKANILIFPLNKDNEKKYLKERKKLNTILHSEAYKLLVKMKLSDRHIEIRYHGTKNSIDEFVIFAYDNDKGFVVTRLLGRHMDAKSLYLLVKEVGHGNLNMDLKGLDNIFKSKSKH